MKTFRILTLAALIAFAPLSITHADLLSDYGVNISDANQYKDGNTLYQLFNKYFELTGENAYTSSNALFNDRGIDPTASWTTSGSELVGAFKVAAFGHEMSAIGQDGTNLGTIYDVLGTENIHSENGISDLSGGGFGLPDGLNVDFQLDATAWGKEAFTWSSDASANADGMIHMIALDITDIYNEFNGTNFDSVFMLGWEDLHKDPSQYGSADWDYQDFVAIVTNLTPSTAGTPEPGTALMFLIGGGAASVLAWRKRKTVNKNKVEEID